MSKRKKTAPAIQNDPNLARESAKYDSPVASREYLLSILRDHGAPLSYEQFIDFFELWNDEEAMEGVRRRLGAMVRDGQLIRNRRGGYVPVENSDLIHGRISAHPDGFGFLIPDKGGDDVFLSAREMRRVLNNDRAVVCVTGLDHRKRAKGRIVDVLERANTHLVGRLMSDGGVHRVVADNKKIHMEILIPDSAVGGAKPGQIVRVEIVEQPAKNAQPVGKVVEVLGEHLMPGMEIEIAIHSHGIPSRWPEGVEEEAAAFGSEVSEEDKAGRKDLRKLPLVTIDGEDAKDFDDAVFCKPTPSGWRLLVAIADVSHYVQPGSLLDKEALNRATSVYFPGRVIPMLPESLSNGLCSLNPDVDRLCMVCEMSINKEGQITRSSFSKAVMRSHARLTYTKVAAMLAGEDPALEKQYSKLLPHLRNLNDLFHALLKARHARGTIDFETVETRIVFDENKKIDSIVPVIRNDAHKIIEECMIQANIAAARYLERKRIPGLFRVHEGAKPSKLDDLRDFLSQRSLSLGGGDSPQAADYARLIREIQGRVDVDVIQTVLLRTLMQAVYHPRNDGHFGLALNEYAHFTSPIRRYPDLLVHRAISHVESGGTRANYMYSNEDMQQLGEQCSRNERRADEAVRDVTDWLKCEYMQGQIGKVFNGVITTVTSFGLFVELQDIFVEGLVHITSLDSDYYRFDPIQHCLIGERSGRQFRLGETLRVQVAAVNLDERKIDFQPVDGAGNIKARSKSKAKSKSRKKKPNKTQAGDTAGKTQAAAADSSAETPPATGKKKRSRRRSSSARKKSRQNSTEQKGG
ncbi:ribonuclease R [Granulosicoccaceae sp. 1_MG-2023]|nr:ribonuclease R [Granulosicoccaceae sp. 1_MG-2023]